jgi:hypothetical protein
MSYKVAYAGIFMQTEVEQLAATLPPAAITRASHLSLALGYFRVRFPVRSIALHRCNLFVLEALAKLNG